MLHALFVVMVIAALVAGMTETGLRIFVALLVVFLLALAGGLLFILWHLAFVDGHVAYALILLSFPIAVVSLLGIFFGNHPAMSFLFLFTSAGVFIISWRAL